MGRPSVPPMNVVEIGPARPQRQRLMKRIAFVFALGTASLCFAGIFDKSPPIGPPFKVHGRLSVYCGTPSCRIWIVGTKRILGLDQTDTPEIALMPPELQALLTTENLIFGDFTVVPLTKDEAGVMRIVRVVAAENLVITDGQLQFVRRVSGKITEEPVAPEATRLP